MKIIFLIFLSVVNNAASDNVNKITITHRALNIHNVYQFVKIDSVKWKYKSSVMPDADFTVQAEGESIILRGTYQNVQINKTFDMLKKNLFPDEYKVTIKKKRNKIIYTYEDKDKTGPPVARAFGTYEVEWTVR